LALALYQEILRVTPGDKRNQQAYVAAHAQAKQLGKAIDLLTQMSTQYPDDPELLVQLAELYHQNRQDEQAAEALQAFVAQSEKTEYLYLRAGRILERYKLKDQAERLYQQLTETWPDSLSAKEAYAQFLFRIEKQEEALALWREIAYAGDVAMLVRATQTVSRRDQREQALAWLESRYETYSDDLTYLATLCQIGQRLEQLDKVLTWARRQLAISERYSQIKTAVAQVVAVAKRGDKTAGLIDELAAQASRSIQQICLLAELYDSVFMSTEADALLAQVGEAHQETALKQQIRLCRLRRDWSLAAKKTEALLARTGMRDSLYVRELVDLYRKDANYEQALAWIPAWKKTSPGNAQAWLTESQLLSDLGREADAISVLRRADQKFEGRPEILSHLANLYTHTDRTGDAQRIYWRLYENASDMSDKIRWIRDMGYAAQVDGSREGIIDKLQERKRDNPSSIVPCLALAEMYRQTGQYEERRQALFAATRIQSKDLGLMQEIARIEEQEGDWEQALETLTRALPLDDTSKTRQKMARIHIQYGDAEAGYRLLFDLSAGKEMMARDAEAIADAMASDRNWASVIYFLV